MAAIGVLKCKQISMLDSEYEWEINEFGRIADWIKTRKSPAFCPIPNAAAQFYFRIESEVSRSFDFEDSFVIGLHGTLSLCSVGSTQDALKVAIVASVSNQHGDTLEQGEKFEESLSNHDINCLKFKQQLVPSQCMLPNNVLVVRCDLNFLNNELFKKIKEKLLIDNSDYFKELSNDLKNIYNSTILSDVTIYTNEKKFKVHRAILAARSPVFRMMLEHDCIESKTNVIKLPDYDLDIFELFLKYLYTGIFESCEVDCVLTIYEIADMYDVQNLQKICEVLIEEKFVTKNELKDEVGNLCKILKFSSQFSCDKLKTLATKAIANNFSYVTEQPEWKEFISSDPNIAKETLINIKSENESISQNLNDKLHELKVTVIKLTGTLNELKVTINNK